MLWHGSPVYIEGRAIALPFIHTGGAKVLRLTQFGYKVTVAIWLLPLLATALWGNAHSSDFTSDVYAISALICLALLAYSIIGAYQMSGQTATRQSAQQRVSDRADAAVLSFENLSAWQWIYCLIVTVLAAISAVAHYRMNRQAEGIVATFLLVYAAVDAVIAIVSFNQFWAIKSGKIVELSNKASSSMFQH